MYWRRAQAWIANNSRMKIQIATDAIVETYNPPTGATYFAYRLTREPVGGAKERIWIRAWCGNMFGCEAHPAVPMWSFKRYVRADP